MAKTSRFNGRQLTTKEFLSIANANAKAASQTLHNIFGLDFNVPMHCGLIDGAFTFNSICNFCEIPRDERPQWVFALLIRQKKACDPRGEMFHVAGYSGYGDVELTYPIWRHYPSKAEDVAQLRGFCSKKHFEEWRKRDDSETLFVLQRKELRKPSADFVIHNDNDADFARYTITKVCGNHFVAKPIDYINNRGTVEYWEESRKASNILDKSGYLVRPGKRSLRKRLAEFKTEKAKIGFLVFAADFPK